MPFTPKLLPWIAHRNRVPRERAEALWLQALALADFRFPDARGSSEYSAYAMRTLLKLAACDGAAVAQPAALERDLSACTQPRSALPIIASQRRIGVLAFDAAAAVLAAANEYWSSALRVAGERRRG